jgi:hypothetical protein
MDAYDIRGSFQQLVMRIFMALIAAQKRAAGESNAYLSQSLAVQGADSPAVLVSAAALSGVASDGRDLLSLLQSPMIQSFIAINQGASPRQALAVGGVALDRIVGTQTFDAGRVADGIGVTANTSIRGYLRLADVPCCGRCAILAGRFYKWSSGFERHPNCGCTNIPLFYGGEKIPGQDPMELFRSGQIRGLSQADTKAIKDGADLNQVINAHRGMSTAAGRKVTSTGTTRRGLAGKRLQGARRLMPEQIYKEAKGDRDKAITLLRAHGFIA